MAEEVKAPKRVRKLEKTVDWETGTVTLKVVSTGATIVASASDLPKEIAAKMVPLAMSHRLGDAAAGQDGKEAEESIQKVWDALKAGNFTVKSPAGPKMPSKAKINEALDGMDAKSRKAAEAVLAKLGIASA